MRDSNASKKNKKCVFIKKKTHRLLKELQMRKKLPTLSATIYYLLKYYNLSKLKQADRRKGI